MATEYHLWRRYPTKPFRRFACTIKPASTPGGYEVTDYDPAVADAGFLHTMADHLRQPRQDTVRGESGDLQIRHCRAGTTDHFNAAIRTVPNAVLRSVGRAT